MSTLVYASIKLGRLGVMNVGNSNFRTVFVFLRNHRDKDNICTYEKLVVILRQL